MVQSCLKRWMLLSDGAANPAKKRSSGKSKGSKSKAKRGGVREEIRQLQEALGVDDPNRTPQVQILRLFDRSSKTTI